MNKADYEQMLQYKLEADSLHNQLSVMLSPFLYAFQENARCVTNGSWCLSFAYISEIDFGPTSIDVTFAYNDGDYYGGEQILDRVLFPADIIENHSKERAIEFAESYNKEQQEIAKEFELEKTKKERERKLNEFNRLKQELGQ